MRDHCITTAKCNHLRQFNGSAFGQTISSDSRARESFIFEEFSEDLVHRHELFSEFQGNLHQFEGLVIHVKQRVLNQLKE